MPEPGAVSIASIADEQGGASEGSLRPLGARREPISATEGRVRLSGATFYRGARNPMDTGAPRPDRLRAALKELPSSFSTAMASRAAGLSNEKALARLQDLERRGEVRRVGKRWSTDAPPSDLAAAMDRLQARTSNLRIVRERARVA